MTGTGVNIAVFQRGKDICNVRKAVYFIYVNVFDCVCQENTFGLCGVLHRYAHSAEVGQGVYIRSGVHDNNLSAVEIRPSP